LKLTTSKQEFKKRLEGEKSLATMVVFNGFPISNPPSAKIPLQLLLLL